MSVTVTRLSRRILHRGGGHWSLEQGWSRCHGVRLGDVTRAAAATRLGPAGGWSRLAVVLGPGVCGGTHTVTPTLGLVRGAQVSPSLAVWCLYTDEMVFIYSYIGCVYVWPDPGYRASVGPPGCLAPAPPLLC